MRILIILFGFLPFVAGAGQLYKCVDAAGHASYQSSICRAHQRMEGIIEFVPETPVATSSAPRVVKPVRSSLRRARESRLVYAQVQKPQSNPCARAKAKRELQLQRLGLKRTFGDLSRIDAAVRTACNGY